MSEVNDRTETGINAMNIDELIEYISDAVVDEIKGQSSSLNTSKTLSNFRQGRFYSETLGLAGVFKQGPIVGEIKHLSGTEHDHNQLSHSGTGGTSGLFGRSDQEIKDIESQQGILNKDVFLRQFDEKDFMPGGKYEKVAKEYIASDDLQSAVDNGDLSVSVQNSNSTAKEGNASQLVKMVNKLDSQNALYDTLKDNKDFISLANAMHDTGMTRMYSFDNLRIRGAARIYSEQLKKVTIRDLVDQWSSTSGDTDPKAVAMQIAANELFGGGEIGHMIGGILRASDDIALKAELKFNPGRKAFLQAQYDATQDYLKQNNIKELIVYRGHEGKRSKLDGGNDVEVNLQPLSSFSLSPQTAMGFAQVENYQQGAKPSVIASIVPAKRIFSLPNTGIGCTGEKEVVILGGKTKSTVIAGSAKLEGVFSANTVRSANDIKVYMLPKDYSSAPALGVLLEGKATKKAIPNLDEDLENADWTKRSWDLPEFGSVKFDEFLAASGMTLAKFKELPVYRHAVGNGLINDPAKAIGLSSIILKGGHGSGITGHRTYREVNSQKTKNLQEIAQGKAKRTSVEGAISTTNIKDVIKNMRNEADLYTDYLAPDTAVRMRDYISSYENILYEGTRNKEFKDIQAKDLDDFGIDAVQKMMHQEIESNRQSFTDHGIRHLEGNTQRQLELMDQMGNPTAMDKLSALAIMTNHDMGYTIKEVREGANPGGGVHQKASGEMFDEQKSQWNEDKVFTAKQFDRISEAIKTHDSTEFSKDNLLNSTRISDNLALFAKEKLPSMFKYVKGGSTDLVEMGKVADSFKKNKDKGLDTTKDVAAFEVLRDNLYKKIDASKMHENLKRDLKAGTKTAGMLTAKFSLGVLAGDISSIKGNKKGQASVEIQYSAWDSFLQTRFDMGQKQTHKLLGDYGVTDFTKTDYDLGGVLELKVVGVPKKDLDGIETKHLPGRHDQSTHGHGGNREEIEVFHGTTDLIALKIMREGIKPQSSHMFAESTYDSIYYYTGDRKNSVYVAKNFEDARGYAVHSTAVLGREKGKYGVPVVFKVKLKKSELIQDERDPSGLRKIGEISSKNIVAYSTGSTGKTWKEVSVSKESSEIYYIPVVIIIKENTKSLGLSTIFKHGTHDQSTHGHRQGGSFGSKTPVTQNDKDLQSTISQISKMMVTNRRPEGWQNSSGYELVEKDGKFFTPAPLPAGVKSGKTKECYRNAATLVMDNPDQYTYCEGFSTSMGIPMSHAWAIDNKTGKVVDPTWSEKNKLPPGKSYFGIAFSTDYLRKTVFKTKVWGLIPDYPTSDHNPMKDGFPADAFYKKSFSMDTIDLDSIGDKLKDRNAYHYIEDYLIGGNIKGMGIYFKEGNADSGNHGHRGRPGEVGGSGGGERSTGLSGKTGDIMGEYDVSPDSLRQNAIALQVNGQEVLLGKGVGYYPKGGGYSRDFGGVVISGPVEWVGKEGKDIPGVVKAIDKSLAESMSFGGGDFTSAKYTENNGIIANTLQLYKSPLTCNETKQMEILASAYMNKGKVEGKIEYASLTDRLETKKEYERIAKEQPERYAFLLKSDSYQNIDKYIFQDKIRAIDMNTFKKGNFEQAAVDQFSSEVQRTQTDLVKRYPDGKVTLYRGIQGDYAKDVKSLLKKNGEIDVNIRSLSSWTTNESTATKFATKKGLTIKKEIPITDVLFTHHTSPYIRTSDYMFGGTEENEYVVGSSSKAMRLSRADVGLTKANGKVFRMFGWDDDKENSKWLKIIKPEKEETQGKIFLQSEMKGCYRSDMVVKGSNN